MRRWVRGRDWSRVREVMLLLFGLLGMFRAMASHDVFWLVSGWILWWSAAKSNEWDRLRAIRRAVEDQSKQLSPVLVVKAGGDTKWSAPNVGEGDR